MRKLKLEELNRASIQDFKKLDKVPVVVILENIRSLSNIGSSFRTADAFKIEAIHLVGITAKPPHREIQKTALGATESVDWQYFEDIKDSIDCCKKKGYAVASVEQADRSIELQDFLKEDIKGAAIILGNEVAGVEQSTIDQSDYCVEIEQHGTKHSLNVSVCASIIMYELLKKFS